MHIRDAHSLLRCTRSAAEAFLMAKFDAVLLKAKGFVSFVFDCYGPRCINASGALYIYIYITPNTLFKASRTTPESLIEPAKRIGRSAVCTVLHSFLNCHTYPISKQHSTLPFLQTPKPSTSTRRTMLRFTGLRAMVGVALLLAASGQQQWGQQQQEGQEQWGGEGGEGGQGGPQDLSAFPTVHPQGGARMHDGLTPLGVRPALKVGSSSSNSKDQCQSIFTPAEFYRIYVPYDRSTTTSSSTSARACPGGRSSSRWPARSSRGRRSSCSRSAL